MTVGQAGGQDKHPRRPSPPGHYHQGAGRPAARSATTKRSTIVGNADDALAGLVRVVADADRSGSNTLRSLEDQVEQACLSVLEVPTDCICAELGDLDHAGELAVDEQRRFDDVGDVGPQGPLPVVALHEFRVPLRAGVIVVVDEKAWVLGLLNRAYVLEVSLKPGHKLLECLLRNSPVRDGLVEVHLVNALSE